MKQTRMTLSAGWVLMFAVLGPVAEARASERDVSVLEARGGAEDMHLAAVPMSLAAYQNLAAQSVASGRCVIGGITANDALPELNYAFSMGLITQDAYVWGCFNGYYPVIDRRNNVGAVCPFQ